MRSRWDDLSSRGASANSQSLRVNEEQTRPDIYFIILDAYARHDDLQNEYGFDNTPFLEALEERGFTIAKCSQSNYAKSKMSVASTLNLDYIQNLGGEGLQRENGEPDWVKIGRLIRRGEVRKSLEAIGYNVLAFQTSFFWTEWEYADLYLHKDRTVLGTLGSLRTFGYVTDFEALLIKTSFGLALADSSTKLNTAMASIVDESPKRQRYEMVNYMLDTLENAALIPGPKFVFAHIVSPHGPYVFSPEGIFVPNQDTIDPGYRNQVAYLNRRTLEIVNRLLVESDNPPIIVIQGDHGGPGMQTDAIRMNILNAYYLPGKGDQLIYDSITPVNTFRLIFDTYFGTDYGLVADKSYYSTSDAYFDFQVVDNPCKAQANEETR